MFGIAVSRDCQRVPVAEEGTLEGFIAVVAYYRTNVKVGIQPDVLAFIAIVAAAYPAGKHAPFFITFDSVRVLCRAFTFRRPTILVEPNHNIDILPRHGERIAAVSCIAVNTDNLTGSPLHGHLFHFARARLCGQRDGLSWTKSRSDLIKLSDAIAFDVDGIGILDGLAIQVVAFAFGIVVFVLIERVVHIVARTRRSFTPHVFILLVFVDRHGAVEGAVADCFLVAANNSAHASFLSFDRHVARHAAVLYTVFILTSDAAHIGIIERGSFIGNDIGLYPAIAYGGNVSTIDKACDTAYLH